MEPDDDLPSFLSPDSTDGTGIGEGSLQFDGTESPAGVATASVAAAGRLGVRAIAGIDRYTEGVDTLKGVGEGYLAFAIHLVGASDSVNPVREDVPS